MSNTWENTVFLMNAKKCIDSMLYIAQNKNNLLNINLRGRLDIIRQSFYINLANLLDIKFNTRDKKKAAKESDSIVFRIYYERNRKSAHHNKNYIPRQYNSFDEEIKDKKSELLHSKNICSEFLPDIITIDYVPHDRVLFRLVNRVNDVIEADINKIKHPYSVFHSYQLSEEGKHVFKEFDTEENDRRLARIFGFDYDKAIERYPIQSVDDIEHMTDEEKERQAVIMEDGINSFEGLQNRQDSCIQMNILFDQNMWCSVNPDVFKRIEKLKDIGFYDVYEISHPEVIFGNSNKYKKFQEIMLKK